MIPLLLSLSLLLPALSVSADPLHVSLTHRSVGRRDLAYYAAAADRLRGKYGYSGSTVASRGMRKRGNTANIPIVNQVGLFVLGIYLGCSSFIRTVTQVTLGPSALAHRKHELISSASKTRMAVPHFLTDRGVLRTFE